ncbi:MAG: WD40 repeat domain-containing protein [Pseudohongiellaceae bacterium]
MARSLLIAALLFTLQACSLDDQPDHSFSASVQGIFSAVYSADASHTVIGSIQHGASLWDTANAERLFNWNHQEDSFSQITAAGFSPEGDFALTSDGMTLVLWDVATGTALRFFQVPDEVLHLALSPRANTALLGLVSGNAVLFDVQNGGIIRQMEQGSRILSMAMSANGEYGLFGLDDNHAKFWNLRNSELVNTINTQGRVQTVALSDDGKYGLVTVQHLDAEVWNLETHSLHSRLNYSNRFFPSFSSFVTARFSKDGEKIITGNTTGALELWSGDSGKRIERWVTPIKGGFKPQVFSVVAVALDEESATASAITSAGTAYRYNLEK